MGDRAPRVAGLHRAGVRRGVCGLCGTDGELTRTHVPPQCALNDDRVRRQYLVSRGDQLKPGRPTPGGLWVRGLCVGCNNLQGRYDPAYGKLGRKLRSTWIKDWRYALPLQRPIPQQFDLHPGSVVRSVLIGMFGLNPNLRVRQPQLAHDLLGGQPFTLSQDKELRLALCRGRTARISGAIGAFDALNNAGFAKRVGVMSDAQVYFPLLAWEFADVESRRSRAADFSSLTDLFGWADVSRWTEVAPDECRPLHNYFTTLPAVAHPKYMPVTSEGWVELMSYDISEILIAELAD